MYLYFAGYVVCIPAVLGIIALCFVMGTWYVFYTFEGRF
jgi:hypothetical protein